jgi:hypothetical protein
MSTQVVYETVFSRFDHGLWSYHFPVPEDIARLFISGSERRVICTINQAHTMHSAIMPDKGNWFIMINRVLKEKLRLNVGDKVRIALEKDSSEFGMPMPEEMQICMDMDESGKAFFLNLTPGKQRSLIYIVSKVKNPELKIRKSLAILHHLNVNKGKLDYKMLNETFKLYNEREDLI